METLRGLAFLHILPAGRVPCVEAPEGPDHRLPLPEAERHIRTTVDRWGEGGIPSERKNSDVDRSGVRTDDEDIMVSPPGGHRGD